MLKDRWTFGDLSATDLRLVHKLKNSCNGCRGSNQTQLPRCHAAVAFLWDQVLMEKQLQRLQMLQSKLVSERLHCGCKFCKTMAYCYMKLRMQKLIFTEKWVVSESHGVSHETIRR